MRATYRRTAFRPGVVHAVQNIDLPRTRYADANVAVRVRIVHLFRRAGRHGGRHAEAHRRIGWRRDSLRERRGGRSNPRSSCRAPPLPTCKPPEGCQWQSVRPAGGGRPVWRNTPGACPGQLCRHAQPQIVAVAPDARARVGRGSTARVGLPARSVRNRPKRVKPGGFRRPRPGRRTTAPVRAAIRLGSVPP